PDPRLPTEGVRPARVCLPRQRVDRGGDVARAPRVGVVAPGPPDLSGRLEDAEVVVARLPQEPVRHGHPAESGADDESGDRVYRSAWRGDHKSDSALRSQLDVAVSRR